MEGFPLYSSLWITSHFTTYTAYPWTVPCFCWFLVPDKEPSFISSFLPLYLCLDWTDRSCSLCQSKGRVTVMCHIGLCRKAFGRKPGVTSTNLQAFIHFYLLSNAKQTKYVNCSLSDLFWGNLCLVLWALVVKLKMNSLISLCCFLWTDASVFILHVTVCWALNTLV